MTRPRALFALFLYFFLCMNAATLLARIAFAEPGTTTPWTIDDILAVRQVSDPQVSPDGRFVAWVTQELKPDGSDYESDLWLGAIAGSEPLQLTGAGGNDESPRWSGDGRWIAFLSDRPRAGHKADEPGDEGRKQVWLIRPAGGEAAQLTDAPGGVAAFEWSADGRVIAFLSHDARSEERRKRDKDRDDAWTPASVMTWNRLWTIDVVTKATRVLTPPDRQVGSFSLAPDGRTACVAVQPTARIPDEFLSDLWLVPTAGGAMSPLVRQKGADTQPRFSPDGHWIAFVSNDGRTDEWWANTFVCMVPAAGGRTVNLTRSFDERIGGLAGLSAPVWAPDGGSVLFASLWRTDGHVYRAFTDDRPVEALTRAVGVQASPSLASRGDMLAWTAEDATHPRDVWVRAAATGPPRRLSDMNPQVRGKPAFDKQVVSWPGADGHQVEGLLISPASPRAGARAPLVLNVHGGPGGTHSNTFTPGSRAYPWPLFVQEGWAVLLPNPHGSGGYGEAFRKANVRDWGGADYADLMAGVDAMVRIGLVDDKKLAVCGWSYGGYMTSTIVTKTDRFKAAVVGAGVTDLGSMATTCDIPEFEHSYFAAWPWEDPQLFVDRSALYHAGSIRTPTAFVHGGADERVPTGQGWELYGALRQRGVPTDILILPREPHGPREPRHQRSVMNWQHDWLTRWTLGPTATGARSKAQPAGAGAAQRSRDAR